MRDFENIEGVLRPMLESDLVRVLMWRNSPAVRQYMLTQDEITLSEHSRWFAHATQDSTRHLLIFELGGIPSGFVSYSGAINDVASDWGFYAAPDSPLGTGRKLGLAALKYAFETVGLHKVCGQALDFNEPSIRFHLALGFKEEGVLREQSKIAGKHYDLICFGLLKQEWLDRQKETNG